MTVAIIAIVAVLLVLGVGLLIFSLMRKSQQAVPYVADEDRASKDNVVGVDAAGAEILESDEAPVAPRDQHAFEGVLQDEISDLGRQQPKADDEG
jgi:hypothetical protein